VQSSEFRVVLGFQIYGMGFSVEGLTFGPYGLGFSV